MSNADQVLDGIAAGGVILKIKFDAITHTAHPELFEALPRRNALPWPIEPHNWPVIPSDWWKPHSIGSGDALVMAGLNDFAEDLAGSNCHPGMIVRNVCCEFQDTRRAMCDVVDAVYQRRRCEGVGKAVVNVGGSLVCCECRQQVDTKRSPVDGLAAALDARADLVALEHAPVS